MARTQPDRLRDPPAATAAPVRPSDRLPRAGHEPPDGDGLFRDWVVALTVGEFLGFLAPAATGVALAGAGVSDAWLVIGLTLAGLIEGAAIGIFGARVLRRHLPGIDHRGWVVATTLAAGFAWLVGMGGSALLSATEDPLLLVVLVPAWLAGLLGMGWAQWLVLRRVIPDSARWIWVSGGAWLVGVAIPVVALSAAPNGWPPAAHLVVGVVSAVAMGATVAVLTGRTLRRLVETALATRRSSKVG